MESPFFPSFKYISLYEMKNNFIPYPYLLRELDFLQIHSSMPISLYLSFPYGVCYSIPLLFSQLFTNLDNSRNSVYLVS